MRFLTLVLLILVTAGRLDASGFLMPTDHNVPPLHITDHLVDVRVEDRIALTTITQTFRNTGNQRLEATYVFPLPDDADLTNFQMLINGKMVQGEILEAKQARHIYESIVRRLKDPGLIEFIGHRLLKMRVFPIEPHSDTTIKVSYQQICRPLSGMWCYHYPLRTPNSEGHAYGTVRFNVNLKTTPALKSIWSPTHAVEVVRDSEHQARIAYEARGASLEDDFLLLYDTSNEDLGLSVVAYKPHPQQVGHFVLMLCPTQLWTSEDTQPQDVVFVIDTSASMAHEGKLDQAKEALRYCVGMLGEQDRFNIVRFSTGFDVLFDGLQPADAEGKGVATSFINSFKPLGGTNIADSLQAVVDMHKHRHLREHRPFVVVFITDGQGNRPPEEILGLLKSQPSAEGLRIYPFGLGHDVNTVLLDQLAGSFNGRVTYVQPGENLELVLGDFFSVISHPVLTDLQLYLPAIGATERFPVRLGDLYHGQQIVLAGCYSQELAGAVRLTAYQGEQKVTYEWMDVSFHNSNDATYVPTVWAGRKIAYLIDQIRAHGETDEMVQEVVVLSLEYGIQTPYTSWLVQPDHPPVIRDPRPMLRPHPRPSPWPEPEPPYRRPGSFGGGAGMGGGAMPEVAGRSLSDYAKRTPPSSGVGSGRADEPSAYYGDSHSTVTYEQAAQSVSEEAGRVANLIARKNATLRDLISHDESRMKLSTLPARKIGDRWYFRVGPYLVDEQVNENDEFIVVRFGSQAYFDVVNRFPELRSALAAQIYVIVSVSETHAILISDCLGVEELTADQWNKISPSG